MAKWIGFDKDRFDTMIDEIGRGFARRSESGLKSADAIMSNATSFVEPSELMARMAAVMTRYHEFLRQDAERIKALGAAFYEADASIGRSIQGISPTPRGGGSR